MLRLPQQKTEKGVRAMQTITAEQFTLQFTDEQYEQAFDYWSIARYIDVDDALKPAEEEQRYKFRSDVEFALVDLLTATPAATVLTISYRASRQVSMHFDRVGNYLTVTAVHGAAVPDAN